MRRPAAQGPAPPPRGRSPRGSPRGAGGQDVGQARARSRSNRGIYQQTFAESPRGGSGAATGPDPPGHAPSPSQRKQVFFRRERIELYWPNNTDDLQAFAEHLGMHLPLHPLTVGDVYQRDSAGVLCYEPPGLLHWSQAQEEHFPRHSGVPGPRSEEEALLGPRSFWPSVRRGGLIVPLPETHKKYESTALFIGQIGQPPPSPANFERSDRLQVFRLGPA